MSQARDVGRWGDAASDDDAQALPRRPIALLIGLDPSLGALLGEWLDGAGVEAVHRATPDGTAGVALAVVEVPFPRSAGSQHLRSLTDALPGTPILALSPTFFAGVAESGSVARQLGVAAVLATPVGRDALLAAVRRLLEHR